MIPAGVGNSLKSAYKKSKDFALNAPEIERKVKDATSNDKWGPTGTQMSDISRSTYNFHDFPIIMGVIWKRINDPGKFWRHVYKSLLLIDYLIRNGSEQVIRECRNHEIEIQTLTEFQYIEEEKDVGQSVRERTKQIIELLHDDKRIRSEREKAKSNRDKYTGISNDHHSGFGGGGGGGYGGNGNRSSGYGGGDYDSDRSYGGSGGGGGGGYGGNGGGYGGNSGSNYGGNSGGGYGGGNDDYGDRYGYGKDDSYGGNSGGGARGGNNYSDSRGNGSGDSYRDDDYGNPNSNDRSRGGADDYEDYNSPAKPRAASNSSSLPPVSSNSGSRQPAAAASRQPRPASGEFAPPQSRQPQQTQATGSLIAVDDIFAAPPPTTVAEDLHSVFNPPASQGGNPFGQSGGFNPGFPQPGGGGFGQSGGFGQAAFGGQQQITSGGHDDFFDPRGTGSQQQAEWSDFQTSQPAEFSPFEHDADTFQSPEPQKVDPWKTDLVNLSNLNIAGKETVQPKTTTTSKAPMNSKGPMNASAQPFTSAGSTMRPAAGPTVQPMGRGYPGAPGGGYGGAPGGYGAPGGGYGGAPGGGYGAPGGYGGAPGGGFGGAPPAYGGGYGGPPAAGGFGGQPGFGGGFGGAAPGGYNNNTASNPFGPR